MIQAGILPVTVAAVFGTRVLTTNLAPSRVEAAPWQETLIIVLLQTEGIAAVACYALVFWEFSHKAVT